MNELKFAYRRLLRSKGLNTIKVLSLGLGFAISFVMLAKVAFELSYDTVFTDADRIYHVKTLSETNGVENDYKYISGAVAPGMKAEIPQVELATRYTGISGGSKLYTDDKRGYNFDEAVLADEYFFEMFDQKILAGDPKEILTTALRCMVSDELAERLGGDVVGKTFVMQEYPDIKLTIGGVFEAFPANSSFDMDILISMTSIGKFTWDGSQNWLGNDRYRGYIKLVQGVEPADIKESIYKMQQKYQDIDSVNEKIGGYLTYVPSPLLDLHLSDKHLSTSILLIGIIGLVVLIMSILNYTLLRITSILNSSKTTAIMKSVGAERKDIQKSIITDTFVHLLLAVFVGIVFVVAFHKVFYQILQIRVSELISPTSILLGIVILIVTGFVISVGPGRIIASQPVVSVMTNYKKTNRRWKLSLLFIESIGVTFLLCTVFFVHHQYNYSVRLDKGYNTDKVYYIPTSAIDSLGIKSITDILRDSPEVEVVSLGSTLPFHNQSGDNIFDPESGKDILHIKDFFWCDKYYLEALKIPIIEGEGYDTKPCHAKNMVISRSCAINLTKNMGWEDGVVGKEIYVTSHQNPVTIIGIFEDILAKLFTSAFPEKANIVMAGGAWYRYCEYMIIRMKTDTPQDLAKVEEIINRYSLFGDLELINATTSMIRQYDSIQNVGYYAIFGSVIALIIAIIGIIGYTEEEVTRRRKELAIRMVNGASRADVLRLFLTDYLKIGVPAVIAGLLLANYAIKTWMQEFSDHIEVSVFTLMLLGLGVLALTSLIMGVYCRITTSKNPIIYLAEE
ncbi:ABC transporter permease [Porphyromonas cangingivalis]|uniref:ABC transporter permease n=1 Tax=Porphyromonas cangingivalis TaxID=36874 RepID=UPI002431CA1A|nr:FtsX-like permease family protein [Porphyromonas cangingivalis]